MSPRREARFGEQPAYDVIASSDRTFKNVSRCIAVPVSQLTGAARGFSPPSPRIRARLPEELGVPLDQLFTEEALAATPRERSRGFERFGDR